MNAAALRENVLAAFEQLGGADWLVSVAKRHPGAFIRLLAQILPRKIDAALEYVGPKYDPASIQHLSDNELIEMANAGALAAAITVDVVAEG